MINRRSLFGATAAFASLVASTLGGRKALAKTGAFADVEPRGSVGRMERLPRLHPVTD